MAVGPHEGGGVTAERGALAPGRGERPTGLTAGSPTSCGSGSARPFYIAQVSPLGLLPACPHASFSPE